MKNLALIIYITSLSSLCLAQDVSLYQDTEIIRPKIAVLVADISRLNEVHTEMVGDAGFKSKQFKLFIQLLKKAKIKELVYLTTHTAPVIRCYAFWGLARRNYKYLDEIFLEHINDDQEVGLFVGCQMIQLDVNGFMGWLVAPNGIDRKCKPFDQETLNRIRAAKRG